MYNISSAHIKHISMEIELNKFTYNIGFPPSRGGQKKRNPRDSNWVEYDRLAFTPAQQSFWDRYAAYN